MTDQEFLSLLASKVNEATDRYLADGGDLRKVAHTIDVLGFVLKEISKKLSAKINAEGEIISK